MSVRKKMFFFNTAPTSWAWAKTETSRSEWVMLTPAHPRLSLVPPGTRAQELWVGAAEALGWGLEPWDPRKEPGRARTSCWLEEQAAWGWCLPGNWSCQPVEWVWVLPHPPVYYTRTVTPLLCWLFKSKGIWCWVPSHQPGRDTFPSFFPLDQGQAQRKLWEALHRCSPGVHWYSRFQALMDWEGRWSCCFHIRSRDKQGNLWRLSYTMEACPGRPSPLLALEIPQRPLLMPPALFPPAQEGLAKSIQETKGGSCLPVSSAFRKCLATFRMRWRSVTLCWAGRRCRQVARSRHLSRVESF